MPIRVVLFDLDGTLADSYRAIAASVNHVRATRGLPPMPVDEVRRKVGRGLPYLLQQCVPGSEFERDSKLYREHHPSVLASGTDLLPGAAETLAELHQLGFKLGICSNKPVAFTRTLVRFLKIEAFLSEVIGPEDVAAPKPAPFMLLEALRRFEVPATDAVYIGDMSVDVQTARAANMQVWIAPTGSETREQIEAAKPDRILDRLGDIVHLLRQDR
jgi:phosphoglycolate phosphatase